MDEDGIVGITSHQSWRIILAKNKKMVFSSFSNEFLWVSFPRYYF